MMEMKMKNENIYKMMAKWLSKASITGYNEIKQHVILCAALVFCLFSHLYLMIFYSISSVQPLVYINVISLLIYGLSMALMVKRHPYVLIRAVIACEVSVYATLTVYILGLGNHTIGMFLLIFILQVLLPYGALWQRNAVAFFSIALTACSLYIHYTAAPIIALADRYQNTLLVSNICIMFFGCLFEVEIEQIIINVINVTNQSSLEEALEAANTDALTMVYNRRYAEEYFTRLLKDKSSVSYCVAMVDIDRFKQINDAIGHDGGDQVLIHVSAFFRRCLRKEDIIFRWGGDEFLFVLKNITLQQAHLVMDELRSKLQDSPIQIRGQEVRVSMSVGISEFDIRNPHKSIEQCDQNLYRGKRLGRNVVFSSAH